MVNSGGLWGSSPGFKPGSCLLSGHLGCPTARTYISKSCHHLGIHMRCASMPTTGKSYFFEKQVVNANISDAVESVTLGPGISPVVFIVGGASHWVWPGPSRPPGPQAPRPSGPPPPGPGRATKNRRERRREGSGAERGLRGRGWERACRRPPRPVPGVNSRSLRPAPGGARPRPLSPSRWREGRDGADFTV